MESKNCTYKVKYCPICENRIRGRSDKKFCSDDCRARYHNSNNKQNNNYTNLILKTLNTNRKILENLYKNGVVNIPVKLLISIGFNLNFFTHTHSSSDKIQVRYIFDIGYKIEADSIKIIHNETLEDSVARDKLNTTKDFKVA